MHNVSRSCLVFGLTLTCCAFQAASPRADHSTRTAAPSQCSELTLQSANRLMECFAHYASPHNLKVTYAGSLADDAVLKRMGPFSHADRRWKFATKPYRRGYVTKLPETIEFTIEISTTLPMGALGEVTIDGRQLYLTCPDETVDLERPVIQGRSIRQFLAGISRFSRKFDRKFAEESRYWEGLDEEDWSELTGGATPTAKRVER